MRTFPIELLKALPGKIAGNAGNVSIEVPLVPFSLDGDEVKTSIRLEGISLPTSVRSELVDQEFTFPVNPIDGYIDGSVYIQNAHHPFDVTSISFGGNSSIGLEVTMTAVMALEFEGLNDFKSTGVVLHAFLV